MLSEALTDLTLIFSTQAKVDTKGLVIAMSTLAGFGFAQPLTFLTVVAQFAVSETGWAVEYG